MIDGKYDVKLVVMGQFQSGAITLKQEADGSLSGKLEAMGQAMDFTGGKTDGKNFSINVSVRGTPLDITGTVDDNGILEGKAQKGIMNVALRGKRE
ncbi:MAG: hypothetical protein ACOX78_04070 [Lachnospiraceae bacterium]|jgi:hypothetical protein